MWRAQNLESQLVFIQAQLATAQRERAMWHARVRGCGLMVCDVLLAPTVTVTALRTLVVLALQCTELESRLRDQPKVRHAAVCAALAWVIAGS